MRDFGINVHVICPGFTRTEFHARCSQDVSGVPDFAWLDSEDICRVSWQDVRRGKLITIPGLHYKLLVWVHRYAPRKIVRLYGKSAKAFLRRGGKNG
jgi:short-subunit dehydrogenase